MLKGQTTFDLLLKILVGVEQVVPDRVQAVRIGILCQGKPLRHRSNRVDSAVNPTMRINTQLLDQVKADAEKNKRSTPKQIEFILEEYIKARSEE